MWERVRENSEELKRLNHTLMAPNQRIAWSNAIIPARKSYRRSRNRVANEVRYSVIDGQELPPGVREILLETDSGWTIQRKSGLASWEREAAGLEPFEGYGCRASSDNLKYSAVTGEKLPKDTAEKTIREQLDQWEWDSVITIHYPTYANIPFKQRDEKIAVYAGY